MKVDSMLLEVRTVAVEEISIFCEISSMLSSRLTLAVINFVERHHEAGTTFGKDLQKLDHEFPKRSGEVTIVPFMTGRELGVDHEKISAFHQLEVDATVPRK